jgi:hypothetical protein
MQRAAAATPLPPSPKTPGETSVKRQRLSPESGSKSDFQAKVQAALAVEEQKRLDALERQGIETGDTRWAFSFRDEKIGKGSATGLKVVQAGFATLDNTYNTTSTNHSDSDDDEPWRSNVILGRKSFGKFNRALEVRNCPRMVFCCLTCSLVFNLYCAETSRIRR